MGNMHDDIDNIIIMYDDNDEKIEFNVINSIEYDGVIYILVVESGFDSAQKEIDAVILKKVSEDGTDFFSLRLMMMMSLIK